jgi:hypothetical protein
MEVSVTYLCRHTKEILRALEVHEEVYLLWRGQLKGIIKPAPAKSHIQVQDHPFFGMSGSSERVDHLMKRLRGDRF